MSASPRVECDCLFQQPGGIREKLVGLERIEIRVQDGQRVAEPEYAFANCGSSAMACSKSSRERCTFSSLRV
jgi:hypothetical protein